MQGRLYGIVWRDKRGEINDVITVECQKLKKIEGVI